MCERYGNRNAGITILRDYFEREIKKNKIKAAVEKDRRQKLIFEIKALEAQRDYSKMIAAEKGADPKHILYRCVSKLAKKHSILAELTDNATEKAEHLQKAEQFRADAKRMKEAK